MKKLYSALLVVALTVAMVLPVFAAPSPQADAKAAKANATVAVAGADVKVLTAEVLDAVEDVVTNPTHLTNLGVSTNAKLAAAFDLEIEIPEGQTSVSVPIKVNNAKVGDYAVILHRRADGQWEKVQLVLVMSRNADLYILDEPLGGVDPATRDYILDTILSNFNENASVIISTHLIADIERILDEVIFIDKGKIILQSDADKLRNKEKSSIDEIFRRMFKC